MTKEKQIEEMIEHVREVTDDCQNCNLYKDRLCDYNCDLCEAIQLACEALYNIGFRKQSEGEWIEASNKPYAACGKKCSLCGARISYREYGHGNHKYCHKCGAKMKGGAE